MNKYLVVYKYSYGGGGIPFREDVDRTEINRESITSMDDIKDLELLISRAREVRDVKILTWTKFDKAP